jgi:hypothetical protein
MRSLNLETTDSLGRFRFAYFLKESSIFTKVTMDFIGLPFLSRSFQKHPHTYGLLVAPSLCKAPNQINTPDNNFVVVQKNFVVDILRLLKPFRGGHSKTQAIALVLRSIAQRPTYKSQGLNPLVESGNFNFMVNSLQFTRRCTNLT